MKITETNTTIGALIERLEATGKPKTTKARAFIIIEDESSQTREDIREAVAQFRGRVLRIYPLRRSNKLLVNPDGQ